MRMALSKELNKNQRQLVLQQSANLDNSETRRFDVVMPIVATHKRVA